MARWAELIALSLVLLIGLAVRAIVVGRRYSDPAAQTRLLCVLTLPLLPLVSQLVRARYGHSVGFVADADALVLALACTGHATLRGFPRLARVGLLAFVVAEVVGLVHSPLVAGLYGLRNGVLPVLLMAVVFASPASADYKRAILREFSGAIQFASAIALVTWREGISWLTTLHLQTGSGGYPTPSGTFPTAYFVSGSREAVRAFSPALGPNELAVLLGFGIIASWAVFRPSWALLLSITPALALAATHSRSGWLAAAVGLAALGLTSHDRRVRGSFAVLVCLGSAAVVAVLIPGLLRSHNSSTVGHLRSLRDSVRALFTRPIGYGTGSVGPRAARFLGTKGPPHSPESQFLQYGLAAGPLSLLGYVLYLASLLVVFLKRARLDDYARVALAQLLALVVVQLVLPITSSMELAVSAYVLIATGGAQWTASVDEPGPPTGARVDAERPSPRRLLQRVRRT